MFTKEKYTKNEEYTKEEIESQKFFLLTCIFVLITALVVIKLM